MITKENLKIINEFKEPEHLLFSFQEIMLSQKYIKNSKELKEYIKFLSKKYGYPEDKIIFNHDDFISIKGFKLITLEGLNEI